MARPEKVRLTLAEFLALPEAVDGSRWELFEGELIVSPSPFTTHQRVSRTLFLLLHEWAGAGAGGETFYAPLDVVLSDDTAVVPDIIWISPERVPQVLGDRVTGAPDLVVEVLSPRTARSDRTRKAELYARLGVRELWLADPSSREVELLVPRHGRMVRHAVASEASAETAVSSLSPDLIVDAARTFAGVRNAAKAKRPRPASPRRGRS